MDALDLLLNRTSEPKLEAPAPQGQALENLFQAAFRVPDHGMLHPYRFVVIEGEGRQKLGEVCLDALLAADPEADDKARDKALHLLERAPMVVAVVSKVQDHPKVPAFEQLVTAGLAAHAMQMAAVAQGFGGIWRTGAYATAPLVREALGVSGEDEILGFLYLGTPVPTKFKVPRPDSSAFVSHF
ncbi:NAD(P)H nitroreductase [Gallaecimonas pentaromativorans]|uniref:NAD(P)H nitroreductase n=1 Tax=Gallaecimonas pentaromativorans TaxID=584787 RepID=UPI00067F7167|nr:NAD(P)H nitroreductase [Gallaecimonas pentaromativorans]MED5525873.1 NAD(P)H nitroreductase [Pseudomonadota bacterium]